MKHFLSGRGVEGTAAVVVVAAGAPKGGFLRSSCGLRLWPPLCVVVVTSVFCFGGRHLLASAGPTGDRLIVAENTHELTVPHALDFNRRPEKVRT